MRFINITLNRLRTESKDCLTLFVIPMIVVVLPWRWSWPLLQRLCRHTSWYAGQSARALENCKKLTSVADEAQWRADHCLTILLDHVDIWLSMLAPWKLRAQIKRRGEFPETGAFVVIGTHWNTGFAVLHQLRAKGHQVVYILRKRERAEFAGQLLRYWYVSLRRRHLEKLFPGKRYTPGSYPRKVIKAFQHEGSVLVLADVPAAPNQPSRQIRLFGQPVKLSSGLAEMVIKLRIQTLFFRVMIDPDSGQRILELESKGAYRQADELYTDLQDWLQRNLDEVPGGWSMWPVAGQFFADMGSQVGNKQPN